MWAMILDRQSIYQLFQARGVRRQELRSIEHFSAVGLPPGSVMAVWEGAGSLPGGAPQILVVRDDEEQDFIAWSAGYMTWLRPLSAHVRILGASAANVLQHHRTEVLPPEFANACLGLILGEAVSHAEARVDLRAIPIATFLRTLGFAFTRSIALGQSALGLDVFRAWKHAREVTRQPELLMTAAALHAPWDAMVGLVGGEQALIPEIERDWSHVLSGALRQIADTGEVSRAVWSRLAEGRSDVATAIESISGTAEERFRGLQRALASISTDRVVPEPARAFVLAYLASRVTPGVMAHLDFLHGFSSMFPGIELWYGLCCGLAPESSVREAANGLGALVMREALRAFSIWDTPFADISLTELSLISDSNRLMQVRGLLPGCLTVEIAPGVCTVLRWPANVQESSGAGRTRSGAESHSAAIRAIAASLDAIGRDVAELERQTQLGQPRRSRARRTDS